MASLVNEIQSRRLILSAAELQALTGWPPQVIEDYLSAIETILSIAGNLDENITMTDEIFNQIGLGNAIKRIEQIEQYISATPRDKNNEHITNHEVRDKISDDVFPQPIPTRLQRLKVGSFEFGEIKTASLVANGNTPAGATSYQLAVKDETDTIVGYIPLYGSAW